jgi:hypothetical protein
MTRQQAAVPADRTGLDATIAAYDRLIATVPGIERKGANLPYTSINGNMFSFVDARGLALRLSPEDRAAFIAEFDARLHEGHGHVMKEYVTVPPPVLADTDVLAPWFAASWIYASALKAKPTTRKAAT